MSLFLAGPLVDAEVADPDRPQGNAIPVQMLVDTGSDLSVLPRDVIDALGVAHRHELDVAGVVPNASMSCPVFRVIVHASGGAFDVDVVAVPRGDIGAGIIGRDILMHLVLRYDGPNGTFTLTPPSS